MKRFRNMLTIGAALTIAALSACQTAPRTQADRQALQTEADNRVRLYRSTDPGMAEFFDTSFGYAVFPTVGSGAFVIGGGHGRGIVYKQSMPIGFSDITQLSIGLQAGGQTFSQVIFFQTEEAFNRFTSGQFSLSADFNAVAVESGAAAQTNFRNGVAVFIQSQTGLMAAAAVGGQRFSFSEY